MENIRNRLDVPDFSFPDIGPCRSIKELVVSCRKVAGVTLKEGRWAKRVEQH